MITREQILEHKPLIIAGPCAVESREQILEIAGELKEMGVKILRAPLWKPRTNKESFQGVGEIGLEWLKEVKEKYGMSIAVEVLSSEHIDVTKGVADIIWVGARNMHNFELLKKLAEDERVAILKRGFISTIKEWIASADYIGHDRVILCERGVRTGADAMRFTMDINSALVAKHDFHLPVIVDPSHTAGRADMVPNLSYSAIASGVDGLIVEVHNDPQNALSDKKQQLTLQTFKEVSEKIKSIYSMLY